MFRFSLTVFTATALLAAAAPLPAQTPGRIELRALAGAALPLGPSDFSDRWNVGPSGALSVGYVVAPHTAIGAEFAYANYPQNPLVLPVVSGTLRTSSPPTSSWAAWLDGSRSFLSGNVRPRIHGGLGVVAFGASRTGLGLRVGAGLDVPVASRLAVVFDAAFAHTFLPSSAGAYPLARSYSYLPLRAGVSWR